MKKDRREKPPVIHPFEVFEIWELAERLGYSENTIRGFLKEGLKYRKKGSIIQILGYSYILFCMDREGILSQEDLQILSNATRALAG